MKRHLRRAINYARVAELFGARLVVLIARELMQDIGKKKEALLIRRVREMNKAIE